MRHNINDLRYKLLFPKKEERLVKLCDETLNSV